MAITLRQLLKNVYYNELRCIAGEAGLDKEILGVNVVDNPEVVSWLYGGELMLSTGYVTKNNPAMLNTLVADLHRKGCVGLGIKVKRYFEKIPQFIIDEGNKYGFPILEISYEMRMSDVSRLVYANLFNEEMSETERVHTIYRKITQSILSGAEIEQALFNITTVIPNPIFITDDNFKLIAYENPSENSVKLSDIFNISYNEQLIDNATADYLFDYYTQTKFKAHIITLGNSDTKTDTAFLAIVIQKKLFGFLVIPQTLHPLNYFDYRILESVVSIIGIHLLQSYLESDATKRSSNNFAANVLLNRDLSDDTIKYYCDIHGFDYIHSRVCINIETEGFTDFSFEKRSAIAAHIAEQKDKILSEYSLSGYTIQLNNSFIIYVFFPNKMNFTDIPETAKSVANDFHTALTKTDTPHIIGISSCGKSCSHISSSFKESLDVISIGKYIYPRRSIYHYQDMFMYITLKNTMSYERMQELYALTVRSLDMYDKQNNTELLDTLEVYLDNHKNMSQAANELHLHRNTMMYRMEKIKDILRPDLDNPEVLLSLQMGIHIKKLMEAYYNR